MGLKIKMFVLLTMMSHLFCACVIAQSSAYLSQNEYESYIESLQSTPLDALSQQEKTGLARAHLERGRTSERIFHLMIKSSQQYLSNLETESSALDARLRMVQNTQTANSSVTGSNTVINKVLTEWFVNGLTEVDCSGNEFIYESDETACQLLEVSSTDVRSIQSIRDLLLRVEAPSTTLLVEMLTDLESSDSKQSLVESLVNGLQAQFIADYVLSQTLYAETNNRPQAMLASFKARDWSYFENRNIVIRQNSDIYRALGSHIQQGSPCTEKQLPDDLKTYIDGSNISKLLGVDALRSCMPANELKTLYGQFLTSYQPPNLNIGIFTASGLLAIGDHNDAYVTLNSIIPRSSLTNLSINKPESMALLTHLKYEAKSEENWRDAREMLYVLQQEFSGLSPAHLVLQLATNSGNRSSINIQID